jgi:predicted kinase
VFEVAATGSAQTRLVVLRGNSGSGKSTVARLVRERCGRGCALVEQDYLRRIVLRERDRPGGVAPLLIAQTARFALDHGYHVVLEGILAAARYAEVIGSLWRAHRGRSFCFYLEVSLEETLRRHATRPQAADFGEEQMRSWYLPADLLGLDGEQVIAQSSTVEETVARVIATSGLGRARHPELQPVRRTQPDHPAAVEDLPR